MAENILEERGYFWWHDEPIPEGHFAPTSCVGGTLSIDETGRSCLELDGYLTNSDDDPVAALLDRDQEISSDKGIQGKLKNNGQSVLLLGLRKDSGRLSTNGISYQGFSAENCLVAETPFTPAGHAFKFVMLEIELTGLEEWLRLGNIEVKRTRTRLSARHRLPKSDVYDLGDGTLTMRYDITGPWPWTSPRRMDKLSLVESVSLQFKPKRSRSLIDMRNEYARMQDLFILLTGSNYSLDWPRLKVGKRYCRYYYGGHRRSTEPPKWDECWTNFVQLRLNFGQIVDAWRRKREEFGPGFYLYLGVRRGMQMYVEHRFVNLIWGLESLHRRKVTDKAAGTPIEEKVQRILDQISDKSDRRWLAGRLKNASEPSLQERLVAVLSVLPFDLDRKSLQEFCKQCADRRNDMSHFGGQRHGGDYRDFMIDLVRKSEALTYLYHAVLLHEIGVDADLLRQHLFCGPSSYRAKYALREAGL